jgi:hypothetical protein
MRVQAGRGVHLEHRAPLRWLVGRAAEDEVNAGDAQAQITNDLDGERAQPRMQRVGDLSNVPAHAEIAARQQIDALTLAGHGRERPARVGQMPGNSHVVSAQLGRVPRGAAASLARGDELANARSSVTHHVGSGLLARHKDVAVEDDDRAVTASRDALHQELLRRGKDFARGGVELRARVRDRHVLVAGAVVGLQQHGQAELLRVGVRAADIAFFAHAPDVIEAPSGRDGMAGAPQHAHGRVLINGDRRRAERVEVPLQTVEESDTARWKRDPSGVVRTGYDLEPGAHELTCLPQTPQERCRHRALRAPEAIELTALAFGRTARARFADRYAWQPLDHRNGRTVIDVTRHGDSRADAFVDEGDDLEDALAFDEGLDAVADLHRRRGLCRDAVDPNMTATTRGRRRRAALVQPHRP